MRLDDLWETEYEHYIQRFSDRDFQRNGKIQLESMKFNVKI